MTEELRETCLEDRKIDFAHDIRGFSAWLVAWVNIIGGAYWRAELITSWWLTSTGLAFITKLLPANLLGICRLVSSWDQNLKDLITRFLEALLYWRACLGCLRHLQFKPGARFELRRTAQRLRPCPVLAEDLTSVPTHHRQLTATYSSTVHSAPFWPPQAQAAAFTSTHPHIRHTCTYILKNKKEKFRKCTPCTMYEPISSSPSLVSSTEPLWHNYHGSTEDILYLSFLFDLSVHLSW